MGDQAADDALQHHAVEAAICGFDQLA